MTATEDRARHQAVSRHPAARSRPEPSGGRSGRSSAKRQAAPRGRGRKQQAPPLVDLLAPAYVVVFLLVTFDVFVLLYPVPANAATLILPAGGVGILLLTPTERLGKLPILWSMWAFIGWMVVSYAWSELPDVTVDLVRSQLVPLVVFGLVVGTIPPKVTMKVVVTLMVLVTAWSLFISFLLPMSRAVTVSAGPDGSQAGFRGTFGHKNLLGVFAVYSLAAILPFFRTQARAVVILICVATVMSTRSATAASGLFAVLFVWFWISAIDSQKTSRERQFLGVVSFMSAFAAVLLALGLMPVLLGIYEKDLTFSGRTFIWEESLVSWARQPIQGYGFGGVWWDGRSPVTADLHQRIGFGASHAHNGAIELLIEVGVVGLGLFLVFLGRILRLSGYAFGRKTISRYGQWGILTVVSMVLMSVSEPLFRVPTLGLLMVLGVVLTMVRNEEVATSRPRPGRRFATTF